MPRYAQLVMGPAGSGKSTYCHTMVQHAETMNRTLHVVNLDPAAEHFAYPVTADVRELIQVDDCMEDDALRFGPNGGLIFCMEYLAQNLDWLREQLQDGEDDYFLFDCPGQIELYTHVPVMKQIADALQAWDFRLCAVFILDAQFLIESAKFVSGMLSALSCMVNLEVPHINVMTKVDLLGKRARKKMERFLDPDLPALLAEDLDASSFGSKFKKLNHAVASVIEDYSLVRFIPLDREDEESIGDLLLQIDMAIQYGEDMEPKETRDIDQDSGMPDDEDN